MPCLILFPWPLSSHRPYPTNSKLDPSLLQASGFLSSWIPEALHVSLLAVETTASLLVRQAVVESSGGRAFGADTRLPGAAITLNTTDAFVSWLPHVSCSRCW